MAFIIRVYIYIYYFTICQILHGGELVKKDILVSCQLIREGSVRQGLQTEDTSDCPTFIQTGSLAEKLGTSLKEIIYTLWNFKFSGTSTFYFLL
jgi:hypothetical protein